MIAKWEISVTKFVKSLSAFLSKSFSLRDCIPIPKLFKVHISTQAIQTVSEQLFWWLGNDDLSRLLKMTPPVLKLLLCRLPSHLALILLTGACWLPFQHPDFHWSKGLNWASFFMPSKVQMTKKHKALPFFPTSPALTTAGLPVTLSRQHTILKKHTGTCAHTRTYTHKNKKMYV